MRAGPKKKLILMVIDACASRVVVPAILSGRLPNLQQLAERGVLRPQCTAIFPSLTPAATSSIFTGSYPKDHNIFGFHWYDLERNEVVYYGDDFWVIVKQGLGQFFEDLLFKLNHVRLTAKTIFQSVEEAGLQAACLNYLMFRGNVKHQANLPLLLSLLPGVPASEELYGPSLLYFGDLVQTNLTTTGEPLETVGGMFKRYGFADENTFKLLFQLAETNSLPDLSLAYFPDNDYQSHDLGPEAALSTIEQFDQKLGDLFELCGGLERFLAEFCLIITGDHAQSMMVEDGETAGIRLDEILADFSIAPTGQPWREEHQLILCPDMRCAQIYFKDLPTREVEHLIALLAGDRRVDQLIWRAQYTGEDNRSINVATLDRGRLRFWPGSDGPQTAVDQYGCTWSWEGNLAAVGGQVSKNNILRFPNYPNAFERITGAINGESSGHIWATAQPGYEFSVAETNVHVGGGSHGSLHVQDSFSPLLIAGAPADLFIPDQPRSVDIMPMCLSILGLASEHQIGTSRVAGRL
ncbi:MAG TPA: alkaline phosphatase family protein [Anaerolineae bacterium]|nr:alkaline phosphatase family protein [Anaerolineae bacterium]